jgi:hypothetical protein
MKDIYKNPTLYYILVPIMVGLWPLFVWTIYLPNAEESWAAEVKQYNKAQSLIAEILTLDRDRLAFADAASSKDEFDYAKAVATVAALCNIPPGNYNQSSQMIIESGGQKSQAAVVNLDGVDIAGFARFLSTIELRWANLQCTRVKLTKKKALPDIWDVDLQFKYYY